MNRSLVTHTAIAAAITLAFAGTAIAAPRAPATKSATAQTRAIANPQPAGGAIVLFDQTASPGTSGVIAMRNLDPGSEPYDAEMADDFAVPSGGWAVSQVRIGTFYEGQKGSTVTPSVVGNITFFADAAGVPGAAVAGCTYTGIALSYDIGTGYSTLNLPTECALSTAGTYWIAFSGDLAYQAEGGGVYVVQQTTTAGAAPVWRNPGDGFGSGCTAWTALTSCDFSTNGGMTVQILGRTTPVSLQGFSID